MERRTFEVDEGFEPTGDVLADRFRALAVALGEGDLLLRQEAPDAVHDVRVTVRRLRSALTTFRPLLEPGPADALRSELGWLGDMLGAVRDPEVLIERFERHLDELPAEEQLGPVRADLVGRVRSAKLQAEALLMDALDGDRYLALVDRLHDFAAAPPYRPAPSGPDPKALRRAAQGELRRVRRRRRAALRSPMGSPERDVHFHEVRKAAKRVRYAAETLRPVDGRRAKQLAARFGDIQEVLGVRNDAVIARHLLTGEGRRAGVRPGHNGYTYGVLAERERWAAAEADARFPAVWKKAGKAARRWAKG
jgi:CHAD domain-containing protein